MSQGLFTASTGIAANQAKIDVIADNIANINTVGFKSSQINFETVFSRQLGSGSSPTDDLGGINPKEIGLGASVGEIGRNFRNGSIQNTGRTTDLNIQGEGFFSLMNYDGSIFLSRAGNFSTDSNGFLVNPQGLKVLGTSTSTSTTASTTPVQIPTKINLVVPDAVATDTITNVGTGASSNITTGTFTINVDGTTDVTTTISAGDTLQDVAAQMQADIVAAGFAGATVTVTGNRLVIDTSGAGGEAVTFNGASGDTSNFLGIMGFSDSSPPANEYTSSALKDQSEVTIADPDDSNDTYSVTTFSIAQDGALEATYSNGAKLSVSTNVAGNKELKYTTAGGTIIANSSITNSHSTLVPAQLQVQLATVINPKGLNSAGGNLFALNSIAGEPTYAIGRSGGLGVINSGALEASNVDLPSEFASMILAQRGIEANSRTFEVQNQIMRTIVNLGR